MNFGVDDLEGPRIVHAICFGEFYEEGTAFGAIARRHRVNNPTICAYMEMNDSQYLAMAYASVKLKPSFPSQAGIFPWGNFARNSGFLLSTK